MGVKPCSRNQCSAWVVNTNRTVISTNGQQVTVSSDAVSWLLGARYLTGQDTTYILEYYRNGNGYTQAEMDMYYSQVNQAWVTCQQSGASSQLQRLGQNQSYGRPATMQDYLYLRIAQKEPWDILYFTPALTSIANLRDRSFSLAPELIYTGITNLELRLKGTALVGSPYSEFGEKQNDARIEFRVRYYF